MDELKERWIANEKVIRNVMKSLVVRNGEDKDKLEHPKAPNKQVKAKLKLKKKVKEKNIKSIPAVVADGTLIFSKFDLVQSDKQQNEKKRKIKKDQKLKDNIIKLKKEENRITKLVEAGESEKVDKIRHENAWKKALEKAEGKKVFDDPKRLERSLKKHQKTKQKHAKEWAERKKEVELKMKKRQQKRERNINKKIEQKQKKKSSKRKNK